MALPFRIRHSIEISLIITSRYFLLFFSLSCGIELEDRVVVTGGEVDDIPIATVQVYNTDGPMDGPQDQLPNLLTARERHACSHYVNTENKAVSLTLMLIISRH